MGRGIDSKGSKGGGGGGKGERQKPLVQRRMWVWIALETKVVLFYSIRDRKVGGR